MNIYEGLGQTIAHTFSFSTITVTGTTVPVLKQGPDSASVRMDLLPPSNPDWKTYFLYAWLYLISITALPNRVNFPILQRQKLTMEAVCPVPHTQSVGSRTGCPPHTHMTPDPNHSVRRLQASAKLHPGPPLGRTTPVVFSAASGLT